MASRNKPPKGGPPQIPPPGPMDALNQLAGQGAGAPTPPVGPTAPPMAPPKPPMQKTAPKGKPSGPKKGKDYGFTK